MKELPKTSDVFYCITIDKGIVVKSDPMVVKDRYMFSLKDNEFSNGNNRFDVNDLYPCRHIGGPNQAPLGMGHSAFIYALEKDVEGATKFLVNEYAKACLAAADEANDIRKKMLSYYYTATGEHK